MYSRRNDFGLVLRRRPQRSENWKNICAIFHKAENESLQSPINLKEEEVTAEMDGNLLAFDYHATNFRSSFFNHTVHLNPVAGEKNQSRSL